MKEVLYKEVSFFIGTFFPIRSSPNVLCALYILAIDFDKPSGSI